MTGGTRYNTSIYKRLYGNVFEGFIRNARTDIYNTTCYTNAHEEEHKLSCDDGHSGGGCRLSSNSTTEALVLLGATVYFIGCWQKSSETNVL